MTRKLEIGYNCPFEVRKESYAAAISKGFTVLYLSDFHLNGYSSILVEMLSYKIAELNPTIILLGGDYVDTKKGLYHFNTFLSTLSARENVYAIAGNHDYFFGLQKIQKAMLDNHINWIEKGSAVLNWEGMNIRIDGNKPTQENTIADFSILCLHKPLNISSFATHYNLAFAGHLHGCQAVLWELEKGLYPGRWFYKWNRLTAHLLNCQYYISKGLGDTLPIRYNCPKDIIFIEVNPMIHTLK